MNMYVLLLQHSHQQREQASADQLSGKSPASRSTQVMNIHQAVSAASRQQQFAGLQRSGNKVSIATQCVARHLHYTVQHCAISAYLVSLDTVGEEEEDFA